MSRILTFADGFTSASAPTGAGSIQENYTITNNTTGGALFTLNSATVTTAFADYEIHREDAIESYSQSGSIIMIFNGSWELSFGNYSGHDIFSDTIVTTENVKLMINSSTGAVIFDSGNMSGGSYIGTLKLNIVRIV